MVKKNINRVIIVTGASSGLGKAISYDLSKRGYLIAACSRNINKLKKNFKKNKNIFCFKVDVTKELEIKNFVKNIYKLFGKIDVLINNAGIVLNSKFESIKTKDLDKLLKQIYMLIYIY